MSRVPRRVRRAQERAHRSTPINTPPRESRWWWVKGFGLGLVLMAPGAALMYAAVASVARQPMPAAPRAAAPHRLRLAQAAGAPAAAGHVGGPRPAPHPFATPVALDQSLRGLMYSVDGGQTWVNFDQHHPVATIHQGEPVGLRAVKHDHRWPWPQQPLKPEWHNGAEVNWGETIYVACKELTTPDAPHLVTVECGNTLTAKIAVVPFHEITVNPDKTRVRITAPDAGPAATTQVTATARVTRLQRVPEAGIKVRFTAHFKDGTSPGPLTGLDADGTATTGADGTSSVTLGSVTKEGEVVIEVTAIDADGKEYAHSKSAPIRFIARHRENEDPAPPQLPDPEKKK